MSEFAGRAAAIVANGFSVIPIIPDGKKPGFRRQGDTASTNLNDWNDYTTTQPSAEKIAEWSAHEAGIGLPCGTFIVAIDIDIVEPELAAKVEREVLAIAGVSEAPCRTGKYPKRALIFRPEGHVVSRSKKWVGESGETRGLDVLASSADGASGKQVVAFGKHPDTGRSYVWRGGSPATVHRDALPAMTPEMVSKILECLVKYGARPDNAAPVAIARDHATPMPSGDINPEAVRWIAENLPNGASTDWDTWVRVGFAFYEATKPNVDFGWQCFWAWSAKNEKAHNDQATAEKWVTITRDSRGTVGFGTLVKEVKSYGLTIPENLRFSAGPTGDNVDLRSYVDRMATLSVGDDGLSARDYAIYLWHVYSGPDNVHPDGILGLYRERCGEAPIPDAEEVSSDEIEAVRTKVAAQVGALGSEDPRSVKIWRSEITTEDMRKAMLTVLDEEGARESDNVVSIHGLSIKMSPRTKPSPPAAASFPVPGLIGEFARWSRDTGPTIMPEFGVTAGLALCATLVGRAVKTATGIRPNIYVVNLATSGVGKNHAISRLRKALGETGLATRHSFGSMAHSGSAIRNSFSRAAGVEGDETTCDGTSMSKVMTSDEMASFWNANAGPNSAHGSTTMGDLLSFFSGSDETMMGTAMADRNAPSIPFPHLSILGGTTAAALFETMSIEQLRAGHANRFIFMEPSEVKHRSFAEKLTKWAGTRGHLLAPDEVLNTVNALSRWCKERQGLGHSMWHDFAAVVPMEQAAIERMAQIEELKEHCTMLAGRVPGLAAEPFTRLDEVTGRIALLSAMSRLSATLVKDSGGWKVASTPEIILADVEFGFQIVRYSAERVAHAVNKAVAGPEGSQLDKVLAVVKESGESGVSRAELIRRTRLQSNKLTGYLDTLNEAREIVGLLVGTKSKKKTMFYATENIRAAVAAERLAPTLETTW